MLWMLCSVLRVSSGERLPFSWSLWGWLFFLSMHTILFPPFTILGNFILIPTLFKISISEARRARDLCFTGNVLILWAFSPFNCFPTMAPMANSHLGLNFFSTGKQRFLCTLMKAVRRPFNVMDFNLGLLDIQVGTPMGFLPFSCCVVSLGVESLFSYDIAQCSLRNETLSESYF